MGDSKRFHIFSNFISDLDFPKNSKIADVAGGKGYMRLAMNEKGFKNVETWDLRSNRIKGKQRFQLFNYQNAPEYDIVMGMHPDEATDHLILYAGIRRKIAIICPCCVKPNATAYWGQNSYNSWLEHLYKLGERYNLEITQKKMPFNGRNDFLFFQPK